MTRSRLGATNRYESRRRSASSAQSTTPSNHTPTHPLGPTYGGTKKRSGAARTIRPWLPGPALHQTAGRPPPWWLLAAAYIANSLLRTRNVGSPQASTSWDSGRLRQSLRRWVRGLGGMVRLMGSIAIFPIYLP